MFNGWTESAEKIEARKARILASLATNKGDNDVTFSPAPEANTRALAAELQDMIEQARGQLGIRQLYALQVKL